ncbi:UvrD-helicase domain-containing protein, partial [Bacteriovoracaceae bacterium]|nr:UvrD-helicase domain-containing protein [Bacteriovoracaceae bacterium]
MVAPNSEQKLAIEHHGGVLLEAGAGAGKTFVIINHLLYCFNLKINEISNIGDSSEKKKILVDYLNSIVVCTFTKDAAGELQKRLKNELKQKLERVDNPDQKNMWLLLMENLKSLNIGTIHSFLYNLVRLGLIEGLNHNSGIISQIEWEEKIKKLVMEADFHNQTLTETEVLEAAIKIFSSPLIRIEWSNYKLRTPEMIEEVREVVEGQFNELFKENNIDLHQISLQGYDEFQDKKWFIFLNDFQKIYFNGDQSLLGLKQVVEFFSNLKRMPPAPRQEQLQEVKYLFEQIKKLRKFLNAYYDDCISYLENYHFIFEDYLKPLNDLFHQVESNYLSYPGIVFSDLEYYVHQSILNSKSLRESLQSSYNYFIVDEFQDTSSIQFDILLNILGNDYSKLFCVGDPKQAIYGFRGGELGVIRDCKRKVPQVLSLKMNYRSLPGVVDFNNNFFDHVLKLGSGFEGDDHHTVEFSSQATTHEFNDEINNNFEKIDIEIENEEELDSFKSDQINLAESRYFCHRIIRELKEFPEKDIAVLYKKLAPSNYLIKLLMENEISFTSIIKVPFADEPLIGIHYVVSRYLIEESDSVELTFLFLNEYLSFFDSEISYDKEYFSGCIKKVQIDLKYLNIETAFRRFLNSLGITSSK